LAQLPQFKAESVLSGDWMKDFEEYSLDQFPFREAFRRIKSISAFYLLQQKDNNDIYIADGHAAEIIYPLSENSVNNAAKKLTAIYDEFLAEHKNPIYLAVIPDKHYFLAAENGYPEFDHERLTELLTAGMPFAEYIEIKDTLSIDNYYTTDSHWQQPEILPVVEQLSAAMNLPEFDWQEETLPFDFYGVYYGQSALPMQPDKISYLTNDILENCSVYNLETGETSGIYDFAGAEGRDPYDFFLYGATPLLVIDNPQAETDRELIIFRDSFGSSLAPLLTPAYSKVTLIDTRYIASQILSEYVDFSNAEVLFIYSDHLMNQSTALK